MESLKISFHFSQLISLPAMKNQTFATKPQRLLIGICATFMLIGCQEAPSSSEPVQAPNLIGQTWHASTPYAFTDEEASREEAGRITQAMIKLPTQYGALTAGAAGWREAHERMQRELAAPSDAPEYTREQVAALHMLRGHLLAEGDPSPEQLDAIGQYTDLLVKHRSPEGETLVDALRRLDGHWPKAKWTAAAERATEGVEAFVQVRGGCTDCPATEMANRLDEKMGTDIIASQQASHVDETASALIDLREMSKQ